MPTHRSPLAYSNGCNAVPMLEIGAGVGSNTAIDMTSLRTNTENNP